MIFGKILRIFGGASLKRLSRVGLLKCPVESEKFLISPENDQRITYAYGNVRF